MDAARAAVDRGFGQPCALRRAASEDRARPRTSRRRGAAPPCLSVRSDWREPRLEPSLFEVLEPFLHECEKPSPLGAIDQPVIVAERQVAHRPDRDRIVDDDGALLDRADTENRDLWLVDERQPVERAKDAWVGD